MKLEVNGEIIEVNEQGYLVNLENWSEDVAETIARLDGYELKVDHWELILYVREYFLEKQTCPTMHTIVQDLAPKNTRFHDRKSYEKHIYSLFPNDPCHEVCKLAGLPMPQPDD